MSARPVSRVVLVSGDAPWLSTAMAGLASASSRLDNPFGMVLASVGTFQEALDLTKSDGEVQIVVIDR